ncbi:hypothetical protein J6590_101875 [Homalodisca vitripennis]|nr:hypothetical protein J6590_101875 [Homalodisca vitripennis]
MSLPQLVVREVLKGSLGKSVVINNCGSPPCHDYQRLPASPVKPDGIIPPRLEFILELLDWNASQEPYNVTVMFFSSDNVTVMLFSSVGVQKYHAEPSQSCKEA